jgi:hypothetical protein
MSRLIITTFAQGARESGWPFGSREEMLAYERKLESDIEKFLNPKKDPYEEYAHALLRVTVK